MKLIERMVIQYLSYAVISITILFGGNAYSAERVVLSIVNGAQMHHFTLKDLDSLPRSKIITTTPWTGENTVFEGISAKTLLEQIGESKGSFKVTALNNYWAMIPSNDIDKYNPLFAIRKDDQLMSVRDKGPIWVIYPLSEFKEEKNEVLHSRMVWQVNKIDIEK
ncbi:oxidoreductase [Vibrio cidicii]|uniref:oxidoreductase n=1 Tax=Vibrio cidicii TaxID=1763883 RepID=UPI001A233496|nr:oxidoreductase [Vibrio cidicii]MBG0754006.1 oxidoreductase [Vibrio cidicii]